MAKIITRDELVPLVEQWKAEGKKVGFTSGAFDIVHAGHISYLQEAKKRCDVFIMGLNTDASIKRYKSEDRPIIPQEDRLKLISAFECVDYVFLFDEDNNHVNIDTLKPSYYIKAGDYTPETMTSTPFVEKHGGEAIIIPPVDGKSTSNIIKKVLDVYGPVGFYPDLKPKKGPVVFLDRDGVINEDIEYLHEPEKFKLCPNVIEGLKKLQENGFRLVVVTNQAGMGQGYFKKEDFYKVNREMFKQIGPYGIKFSKIYYCGHNVSENCNCQKPKTGMINQAKKDLNIDMENSFIIGDNNSDILCGKNSGLKTIGVLTGQSQSFDNADFVAKDLVEAASYIIGEE